MPEDRRRQLRGVIPHSEGSASTYSVVASLLTFVATAAFLSVACGAKDETSGVPSITFATNRGVLQEIVARMVYTLVAALSARSAHLAYHWQRLDRLRPRHALSLSLANVTRFVLLLAAITLFTWSSIPLERVTTSPPFRAPISQQVKTVAFYAFLALSFIGNMMNTIKIMRNRVVEPFFASFTLVCVSVVVLILFATSILVLGIHLAFEPNLAWMLGNAHVASHADATFNIAASAEWASMFCVALLLLIGGVATHGVLFEAVTEQSAHQMRLYREQAERECLVSSRESMLLKRSNSIDLERHQRPSAYVF